MTRRRESSHSAAIMLGECGHSQTLRWGGLNKAQTTRRCTCGSGRGHRFFFYTEACHSC